jgi:hypothetical protein
MLTAMADCNSASGDRCKIGYGAAAAIVAAIFYFVVAAIVFKIPMYESDSGATEVHSKEAHGKNVTIEVISYPDGTKKTIKTTIDENGNKTVEEIIEDPREEQYPEEEEVVTSVLPDGSIKTTRTTYDEEGCKIVTETIESADSA